MKLHPDNNRGDPDANSKFILLNKAYACLSDEKYKENCQKYGSPDANEGSFKVGIALPSFLMKKENRYTILAFFFIFILVILPITVMYFYTNSENEDEFGTDMGIIGLAVETFRNDNILFKNFIELISLAKEN